MDAVVVLEDLEVMVMVTIEGIEKLLMPNSESKLTNYRSLIWQSVNSKF